MVNYYNKWAEHALYVFMKNIKFFKVGDLCSKGIYCCFNCGQKVYIDGNKIKSKCLKCGCEKFTLSRQI